MRRANSSLKRPHEFGIKSNEFVQKTSRASGYRFKYGVAAAGAVGSSLIGQLSRETLGPVCGVSYRVASRIANTLHGGYAVRSAMELNSAPAILFHAPPDQVDGLLELLELAPVEWNGKPLIFCDCIADKTSVERFNALGASVAMVRKFEIPGYLILEGTPPGLITGHRIAKELRMKPIEISAGCANVFDAALTLGTCALTPLIDTAAAFLRQAGCHAELIRLRDLGIDGNGNLMPMETNNREVFNVMENWLDRNVV